MILSHQNFLEHPCNNHNKSIVISIIYKNRRQSQGARKEVFHKGIISYKIIDKTEQTL